jgi:hypothetical protein
MSPSEWKARVLLPSPNQVWGMLFIGRRNLVVGCKNKSRQGVPLAQIIDWVLNQVQDDNDEERSLAQLEMTG